MALTLVLTVAACSDDGGGSVGSSRSAPPEGSTGTGPTTTTTGASSDPSAGIPQDQFCRGYAEVRGSEQAIADAVASKRVQDFKTAYGRLSDAYLAMAENPPDGVSAAVRAVAMLYDDLGPQVAAATSTQQLNAVGLQVQGGEHKDDLQAVRDYGAEHC